MPTTRPSLSPIWSPSSSAKVIADYSQVALLLHSVREDHSGVYLDALEAKGIPAFCPRARTYFENDEVRDLVACFAVILGWHGDGRGQVSGAVADLAAYVDDGIVELGRDFGGAPARRRPAPLRRRDCRALKGERSTCVPPTTSTV